MSLLKPPMEANNLVIHAVDLVRDFQRRGLRARLFGGIAISLLSNYERLFGASRRTKDIDIVADLGSHRAVWDYLQKVGWQHNNRELFTGMSRKAVLRNESLRCQLDLYCDPLVFNHRITLGSRLDLFAPTITPTDLLLTKLQIHCLTETDVADIVSLVEALRTANNDEQSICLARLAEVCAADWGLFFTTKLNLDAVRRWVRSHPALQSSTVLTSVDFMWNAIGDVPKSVRWKFRDWLGPRFRWYLEVD